MLGSKEARLMPSQEKEEEHEQAKITMQTARNAAQGQAKVKLPAEVKDERLGVRDACRAGV